jgi:hypothetical protein
MPLRSVRRREIKSDVEFARVVDWDRTSVRAIRGRRLLTVQEIRVQFHVVLRSFPALDCTVSLVASRYIVQLYQGIALSKVLVLNQRLCAAAALDSLCPPDEGGETA